MEPVRTFPILGIAFLTFSIELTLSRVGRDEPAYTEITWDWSAAAWVGGGIIWSSQKEG
jgi:hypothetical protein